MMENLTQEYSFTRYLAAKKSVDDRALNRAVWQTLEGLLPANRATTPLRVLEVGAGIGTMIERLLDWQLLGCAEYTAVDSQPENIAAARQRLVMEAPRRGFRVREHQPGCISIEKGEQQVMVELVCADLFDFSAHAAGLRSWDLLIAHAFLDLMDVPATLPVLFRLLSMDGLFYFTLNFDGMTLFEPVLDPEMDEQVLALYHQSMDQRLSGGLPSGDSRTGRHLFTHLRTHSAQVLAAGASDWVVFPGQQGYPDDEAYFLHFILHTIQQELGSHPGLDPGRFARWIAERHQQVDRGELVYLAHQLDFVGRALSPEVKWCSS